MLYFAEGSADAVIDAERARALVADLVAQMGPLRRVLLLPPDYTRFHSGAGALTSALYGMLADRAHVEVMPALGTHAPMSGDELARMFPGIPAEAFRIHDWRNNLARLGEVPASFIREITGGQLTYPIATEIDRLLVDGAWDRIISIGQLVPHEVAGIANHAKNVFVGAGGPDVIHRTHYVGAVHGIERTMGQALTPVRAVLDYMATHHAADLPIVYLLTVRTRDADGRMVTRGLFAGEGPAPFVHGAPLCRQVNVALLDEPIEKAVVYLDPQEFKSTWLGNKAIYRLRMAIADGGELIVLAPGVDRFGEDATIDRLIREFGYRGSRHTQQMVATHEELAANLAAAAHLIHGSSEGRFAITYAAGGLSRSAVEGVGFRCGELAALRERYDPRRLRDGWNAVAGERIFYVSNPGLGLWSTRARFEQNAIPASHPHP